LAPDPSGGILPLMNTPETFAELARAVRDLIRTGVVSEIDTELALCRVQTGELVTDWLHWLTPRAGGARTWWAPSIGEQVLILSLGGELDTAFVLPAIYSDDFPAPSVSAQAYHIQFSDGAVMQYEPETGSLEVKQDGTMTGNISHSDGSLSSNGVTLHPHKHSGINPFISVD